MFNIDNDLIVMIAWVCFSDGVGSRAAYGWQFDKCQVQRCRRSRAGN